MKTWKFLSMLLLAAGIVLLSSSCDVLDDENDIIVTNGSGCSLASITLDGVDKGAIGNGETRKFDNVNDGVHVLEAFHLVGDTESCDSHTTDDLKGNDDDFWLIECDCD